MACATRAGERVLEIEVVEVDLLLVAWSEDGERAGEMGSGGRCGAQEGEEVCNEAHAGVVVQSELPI